MLGWKLRKQSIPFVCICIKELKEIILYSYAIYWFERGILGGRKDEWFAFACVSDEQLKWVVLKF